MSIEASSNVLYHNATPLRATHVESSHVLKKIQRSGQKVYGSAARKSQQIFMAYSSFEKYIYLENQMADEFMLDETAIPHADVETSRFYTHIEASLPEPRRMRQLLTWCASRALLEKPRPTDQKSTMETIAIESGK
jgi:hypothetical protein